MHAPSYWSDLWYVHRLHRGLCLPELLFGFLVWRLRNRTRFMTFRLVSDFYWGELIWHWFHMYRFDFLNKQTKSPLASFIVDFNVAGEDQWWVERDCNRSFDFFDIFSYFISCTSHFLPDGGVNTFGFFILFFVYSIYLVQWLRHLSVASWEVSVEPETLTECCLSRQIWQSDYLENLEMYSLQRLQYKSLVALWQIMDPKWEILGWIIQGDHLIISDLNSSLLCLITKGRWRLTKSPRTMFLKKKGYEGGKTTRKAHFYSTYFSSPPPAIWSCVTFVIWHQNKISLCCRLGELPRAEWQWIYLS